MEGEMEMRALEDIDMAEDIIPPISSLAFSLHDSFLSSHCSACFRPFLTHNNNNNGTSPLLSSAPPSPSPPLLPSNTINLSSNSSSTILYCSPQCSTAESELHFSSGEHHLLSIFQSEPPLTWNDDTSDLRTSLRLLLRFERLGLLSHHQQQKPNKISGRIAGLISNRERIVGGDDAQLDDVFAKVQEGARLMSLARRARGYEHGHEQELEEFVLCQVLMNAVEVQDSEGRSLGVAVYGPSFSWINHSCSPDACYRFILAGSETHGCLDSGSRIVASGDEALLKTWVSDESKLNQGWCGYGPRIVVRSIKPIKKGEEVLVAYTDLLQPKAVRHAELWLRYRFICNCSRCASPMAYVDCILQGNFHINDGATKSVSEDDLCNNESFKELSDFVDEAISDYLSDGEPESLCDKLESMLIGNLWNVQIRPKGEPLHQNLKLHPLHYLSLNAYISLASAYKVRASQLQALQSEMSDQWSQAFDMSRSSAAYCLLLAGTTHYLFLSETSLIATAANFWVDAGESLLSLSRSSRWSLINEQSLHHSEPQSSLCSSNSRCKLMDKLEIDSACHLSPSISKLTQFEELSECFLDCISRFSPRVWPFLIQGHSFLGHFTDPIDFGWLGMLQALTVEGYGPRLGATDVKLDHRDERSSHACGCEGKCTDGGSDLYQLGTHCLLYGAYLSSICYGSHGLWARTASDVSCGENVTW